MTTAVKGTHTPGPWRYLEADGVIVSDEKYGAREIGWNAADHRLAAAAPELLEALKASIACDDDRGWADVVSQCRAAIAKAEGR